MNKINALVDDLLNKITPPDSPNTDVPTGNSSDTLANAHQQNVSDQKTRASNVTSNVSTVQRTTGNEKFDSLTSAEKKAFDQ